MLRIFFISSSVRHFYLLSLSNSIPQAFLKEWTTCMNNLQLDYLIILLSNRLIFYLDLWPVVMMSWNCMWLGRLGNSSEGEGEGKVPALAQCTRITEESEP